MGTGIWIVALSGLAAAAASPLPSGARLEPSGFATIGRVPSTPLPDQPPPAENRPGSEAEWYARANGISVAEATKRQREQQALLGELNRLGQLLPKQEAGNYAGVRMVHQPDWAYIYYFKRDPQRTLAKYTRHPRFRAELARYTEAQLQALLKPWTDRFAKLDIMGGWGTDATAGTGEIMLSVTAEEFRAIAAREGWGTVPPEIKLSFAQALPGPAVSADVQPFVRIFAQNERSTVVQLTAAASGRISLRDGCFYLGDRLAFFHRETGLGRDAQGYLALIDRATGKVRGRIGERMTWAGPNALPETSAALRDLKARCGDKPVAYVGSPESSSLFRVRAWEIDEVAQRRRISRERAYVALKRCWTRAERAEEAGRTGKPCGL